MNNDNRGTIHSEEVCHFTGCIVEGDPKIVRVSSQKLIAHPVNFVFVKVLTVLVQVMQSPFNWLERPNLLEGGRASSA